MAFLDFLNKSNAAQSIESLPASVKAQAIEVAKPAAEIMGKGAQAQDIPPATNPTPNATPARGRSLGWER